MPRINSVNINENKIVKITRNNDGKGSWRNFLSSAISEVTNNKLSLLKSHDNLDVPEVVELCLSEGFPKIEMSNGKGTVGDLLMANKLYSAGRNMAGRVHGYLNIVDAAISDIAQANGSTISDSSLNWAEFYPWYEDVPVWGGAAVPIEWKTTFSFTMGQFGLWDARKEVVLPILNLIAPVLPRVLEGWMVAPPYPSGRNLFYNIIEPVIETALSDDGINNAVSAIKNFSVANTWSNLIDTGSNLVNLAKSGLVDRAGDLAATGETSEETRAAVAANSEELYEDIEGIQSKISDLGNYLAKNVVSAMKPYTMKIQIGSFIELPNTLLIGAKPNFNTIETDNNGYPISGQVDLEFKSIVPASLAVGDTFKNTGLSSQGLWFNV